MTDAAPLAKAGKQPAGLYLLFGVEMWERFSYYGMRAFLILFLVAPTGFGWSKQEASHLYGWYTGLVYLTPILGGYLADRVLGLHRAIIVGSVLISAGHFTLVVPGRTPFFIGLALIVLGTGFHKSNISTMVGQLYGQNDPRRDAGFTIFYMGINAGAFFGPLLCGYLAKSPRFGWHWGFGAAGVGMVLGLVTYLAFKRRYLGTIGDVPAAKQRDGATGTADHPLTHDEKQRIGAIAIIAFFVIFFWMAFEQAGSSMNFFAEERTNRELFGTSIPAPWFQSINAIAIIAFAPLFAAMWSRLGARGREPSTPIKMAIGIFLVGFGFIFMVCGARLSDGGAKVSPLWLVAAYVVHTWGELCLSPVGLSTVTKLAPAKLASMMMGVWFLANFFSDLAAGLVAGTVERVERGEIFHVLGGQADFFLLFVVSSTAAGLLLLAMTPVLKKLMHGRA